MALHHPQIGSKRSKRLPFLLGGAAVMAAAAPCLQAVPITITAQNRGSTGGFFVTPLWFAFHDGSFELFDNGSAITAGNGFETLVEDGVTGPTATRFNASSAKTAGGVEGTITAPLGIPAPPVYDPGETATRNLDVNPIAGRFFTYAAMVIPSNDAFIANDNPTAIRIFDDAGNFIGPVTIMVLGSQVRDAGTELNNEMNAAFFNQPVNGDGTATPGGLVTTPHPGLFGSFANPGGTPIILGHTSTGPIPNPPVFFDAVAADFTQPGVEVFRITITPEPSAALLALSMMPMAISRRRRRG